METITEDMSGDVEEEADQTYEQILGEVGLDLINGEAVPSNKIKGNTAANDISDLEKQLQNLKQ